MVGTRVLQVTNSLIEISPMQGRGAVTRTIAETGITDDGTDAERQKIAAALTVLLQREMETWIHVDDLGEAALGVGNAEETLQWSGNRPADIAEMQARYGERMRYEKQGPNTWLVSTEDIITVTWDAAAGQYIVSVRGAR